MRKLLISALSLGALGLMSASPAAAQPLSVDQGVRTTVQASQLKQDVQYRRYYGGRRYNRGAAVGAGIAGLAAGAIIGGAIANSQRPAYYYDEGPEVVGDDAVSYCMSRFRSYDPASGTYMGYDGYRHACP